jgi:hypothetical protein
MKTCEGVEVLAPPFLTLKLDGGELSASLSGRFNLGESLKSPYF